MNHKADDLFDCGWCGGRCHDILDEWKGRWTIECCFCGLVERVFRVDGVIPKKQEKFVFPAGRLKGMTIDEAAEDARGLRVIQWSAENEESAETKEACKAWLDSQRKSP